MPKHDSNTVSLISTFSTLRGLGATLLLKELEDDFSIGRARGFWSLRLR